MIHTAPIMHRPSLDSSLEFPIIGQGEECKSTDAAPEKNMGYLQVKGTCLLPFNEKKREKNIYISLFLMNKYIYIYICCAVLQCVLAAHLAMGGETFKQMTHLHCTYR